MLLIENKLIDGGTLQIIFKSLSLDHYPYHKFGSDKTHWNNYNYIFKENNEWSNDLLKRFLNEYQNLIDKSPSKINFNLFLSIKPLK